MSLSRFEPPGPFRDLQDRMGRLFNDALAATYGAARGYFFPSVDVMTADGEVVVRADLPGVDPANIQVHVTENSLSLRGEARQTRTVQPDGDQHGFYQHERRYGAFERTISLPAPVDPDRSRATAQHGVLEVRMPIKERHIGRRIEIQTQ